MSKSPKVLGVIPVRFESRRLPGKALLEIAGRPMLHRVYENARRSSLLHHLVVATDSGRIKHSCEQAGIPVVETGKHASGTDRLNEVLQKIHADIYVNIQGDEPLIRPDHLDLLLGPLFKRDTEVSTLKVELDVTSAQDPNKVKVVTDVRGRALYFSRHPIPFDRAEGATVSYYKHIGVYAYTREALQVFHSLPQSSLELAERLEQLRFLQNGIDIFVAETPYDTIGVDTEEDLRQVSALFSSFRKETPGR